MFSKLQNLFLCLATQLIHLEFFLRVENKFKFILRVECTRDMLYACHMYYITTKYDARGLGLT